MCKSMCYLQLQIVVVFIFVALYGSHCVMVSNIHASILLLIVLRVYLIVCYEGDDIHSINFVWCNILSLGRKLLGYKG